MNDDQHMDANQTVLVSMISINQFDIQNNNAKIIEIECLQPTMNRLNQTIHSHCPKIDTERIARNENGVQFVDISLRHTFT